jgi:cell division septation protein DedD
LALASLGVLLATGSAAAAAAALVVHGKGELVSQPLTGDLAVVDARLEPLLIPGAASDLVLQVRNRSAFTVVADRVRLELPLQDTRPAGCAAKVSGPLLAPHGVALVGTRRVTLGPGRAKQVVVPSALSLAAGAKGGCGFRVVVDVQAIQASPTVTPPTTATTTPPTTAPTTTPPTTPATTPAETIPATVPTSVAVTPPTAPTLDCDPVDPSCNPG